MKCTFSSRLALLIIALSALACTSSHAQIDINGGYENGIFSGTTSFAGGLAQDLNAGYEATSPTFHPLPFAPWLAGWNQADLSSAAWVDSSAAYDGNHYLYLSGKDVCYNLLYGTSYGTRAHIDDLIVGQTYSFCVYAAAASSADQVFRVEWNSPTGATDTSIFNLAGNSAWSDTALSTIPWQQYCYTFTADSTNGVLTFSTDATTGSALVLDGASLSVVPEPASSLLLLTRGVSMVFQRARRSLFV